MNDITAYTTPVFSGMISLLQPSTSWVGRFHKAGNQTLQLSPNANKQLVQGLYAVQVTAVETSVDNEENEYDEEL